jgi:hypothetical protein
MKNQGTEKFLRSLKNLFDLLQTPEQMMAAADLSRHTPGVKLSITDGDALMKYLQDRAGNQTLKN